MKKKVIRKYKVLKRKEPFIFKGKKKATGSTIETDIDTGCKLIEQGLVSLVATKKK